MVSRPVRRAAVAFATLVLVLTTVACGVVRKQATHPSRAASGATYYVSPSGSDSNPGTSDRPWGRPGYASRHIGSGDTLVILRGRYALKVFDDDIVSPPSGTAGAPTVVRGEAGARPVLAGSDNLFSAVDISGKSYVRLENLEITSDGGAPFRGGIAGSGGPVNHVVFKDLYVHHIDEGAVDLADVEDLQVLDCVFSYCGFGCLGGPEGKHGGWRNVVVRGCELSYSGHYYQGGPGPGPYDRPDGFGVEPSEGPIEISNTVAKHNKGDGLDSKSANTYIHDCVVANNSCDGVKLWDHDSRIENTLVYGTGDGVGGGSPWAGIVVGGERTPGARFVIENVTVHDNPSREAYPIYAQYDSTVPIDLTIRNTIIAGGHGEAYFGDAVRLTADHDIFYRPGGGTQVHANGRDYDAGELGALGAGNISRDPEFVSPAWGSEGDYHLKEGSPAIDSGTAEGAPPEDLDGNPRPNGGSYDIGCYEYGYPSRPVKPVGRRDWGHDSIGATSTAMEWYFAEGCTAPGFETWVLIENPGNEQAEVDLTFMTGSGGVPGPKLSMNPRTRRTVNVADTVKDSWEVSTRVTATKPVIAERSMYGSGRAWGHESIGATAPATDWYLAEGCTATGFETWVLIENPGNETASIQLTHMTDGGVAAGASLSMSPNSRMTVNVADAVKESWGVSTRVSSTVPIVVERAMYGDDRTWGHDSIGVTSPAVEWYLAEGCTAPEFETWVLVQNAGSEIAEVRLTYMTAAGSVPGPRMTMNPGTRQSVDVADTVKDSWGVSTKVTSSKPIVVERAMYGDDRTWGHDSIGVTSPANEWFLAEGCTAPGFETWVLIVNPGTRAADVQLTYMTAAGSVPGPRLTMNPGTRQTVDVADTVNDSWGVSTKVTSTEPVVVERAMYGESVV